MSVPVLRATPNPELDADLPALPWCIAKGIAKMVLLSFILVLLPLEVLSVLSSIIPIQFPLPGDLLVLGGFGIAICSGAATAAQTARSYGLFLFLSSVFRLGYLTGLAITGFLGITVNMNSSNIGITFGFADLIYLIMIGSILAAVSALITLVEDLKHPGERLPFQFPLTSSQKVNRLNTLSLAPPPAAPMPPGPGAP